MSGTTWDDERNVRERLEELLKAKAAEGCGPASSLPEGEAYTCIERTANSPKTFLPRMWCGSCSADAILTEAEIRPEVGVGS